MFPKQGIESIPSIAPPEELSISTLRQTASWIRDDLDPLVSREGTNALHPDEVLTLHSLLLALQRNPVSVHILRSSRIYLAVRDIHGKATRWPGKLVDEADHLVNRWEGNYGPLKNMRTPLYEKGGRLNSICEPKDTDREALVQRFARQDPKLVDNQRAYFHGDIGFKPGKWWINGLFAFRDGIISSKCTDGGIVFTQNGAYALVMRGDDETNAPSPDKFTYRCRVSDAGRFRLTSGDFRSRYPVRVLRDHRLASLWAPRAGIRYDGLYKVVGWAIRPIDPEKNGAHTVRYDVHFQSEETSENWDKILQVPTAGETDDYKMYKIIHREQREYERRGARDIFESIIPSPEEVSPQLGTPFRSMSLSQVAVMYDLDGKHPSDAAHKQQVDSHVPGSSTSDSGHSNASIENKTPMDGSSDKAMSPLSLIQSRRVALSDLFILSSEGANGTSSNQNHIRTPLGFAAVEPFATLRRQSDTRQRSYDGSDDYLADLPAPSIDTRFRPVNWNPAPRVHIAPAFDLSEDTLNQIAPFSDLKRKTSMDATISPKTSNADSDPILAAQEAWDAAESTKLSSSM